MTAPTQRTSRLPSLTGLRFIAAFLVVLCHIGIQAVPRIAPEDTLVSPYVYAAGSIGVSFFFILSGFILTWITRADDTRRAFWRRRVVKIFPLHLVTLAGFSIALIVAGLPISGWQTVSQIFLIQSFIPNQDLLLNFTTNTPAWSLSCEMFFYALFPWLLVGLARIPVRRLGFAAIAVLLGLVAMPLLAFALPEQPGVLGSAEPWYQSWFVYFFPVARLWEFMLGIVLGLYLRSGRRIRIGVAPAAALCVLGFVGSAQLPAPWNEVVPAVVPLTLLIAAVAQRDMAGARGWLASRPMVFLGEISFALYISHLFVVLYGPLRAIVAENWFMPSTLRTVIWQGVATVALSIALAWVLYAAVEKPAMRFSRSRRKAESVATPAGSAVPHPRAVVVPMPPPHTQLVPMAAPGASRSTDSTVPASPQEPAA